MDKKIIKGLIDEKLEVIQEQFTIIREYEAKIPIIEIDLLMASIRDLYELVQNLQLENTSGKTIEKSEPEAKKAAPEPEPVPSPLPDEEPEPEEKEQVNSRIASSFISMEPVAEEETDEEAPSPAPEPEMEAAPEPEPVDEEINEPEPESSEQIANTGEDIQEPTSERKEDVVQEESPHKITIDLFSDNAGSTLADRLNEGHEKMIADKLQENKVEDLRTMIGINDKFLFINELFDGNMRVYEETLEKMNISPTIAQTDLHLLDLKIAYNWDSESPTVKKFVELVRRKF